MLTAGGVHAGMLAQCRAKVAMPRPRLLQVKLVGKQRLVLDLSCRKKEDGKYYVVTDRWQKFSSLALR